jgi:hypothetical protein
MNPICRTAFTLALLATMPAYAADGGPFSHKDKDAEVKLYKGDMFKGKSTLAIGAFRVAFTTEDTAYSSSHGAFSNGGSAAKMTGSLVGVDHALMQKIADQVYADFLKQAAGKGYTIIDSNAVATKSTVYSAVTQTVNYADSRIGTLVIPTGQRSVALAADDSAKAAKGAATLGSAFGNLGKQLAKSDANKAFPVVAKDVAAPVIGVTIVVNFANFKGTSSSFGSSKATVEPGATIDGSNKNDLALFTSILAWDGSTCAAAVPCEARVYQEGQIHSSEPIGKTSSDNGHSKWFGNSGKGSAVIDADPALFETHVLEVSTEASEMMLAAIAKEK